MDKTYILHLVSPEKNVSPFDVNMACDAGWQTIMPYTGVELEEIGDLVQDAIFSRGPKGVRHTGLFIGGRDMHLAMNMLDHARRAMVPPFQISVLSDPSGAFTTAAGLVAAAQKHLKGAGDSLEGKRVLVLGGTGPVGLTAALLAARSGAQVVVMGRNKDKAEQAARLCNREYGGGHREIEGDGNDNKEKRLSQAQVVFATAKAGVTVLSTAELATAGALQVAADINAVPPAGIEGIQATDDGVPLPNSTGFGIGALAVGNIKYQTQHHLLRRMREAEAPQYLHFEHACDWAMDHVL